MKPIGRIFVVRDLMGRVRLAVSDTVEKQEVCRSVLAELAASLHGVLGPHAYSSEQSVLFLDSATLEDLHKSAREIDPELPGAYLVDRLVTGSNWWTVGERNTERSTTRYTLFSVKGGVGRSTTCAVLSWHLAQAGHRVLVVDLDLESPGLSSAMLDRSIQPRFGITDWFVEDLVGQGAQVIEAMSAIPPWAQDFEGEVRVVAAYGADPGDYLAKLGRVYLDTEDTWTARVNRLLSELEETYSPSIVLIESRSGLHDIAATSVTDLDALVLLFAVDSESNWSDYGILFRHWQSQGLAPAIRERLSIVSGLTPELETTAYLGRFRERAWNLFQCMYDDVDPSNPSGDEFSFDLNDESAPHDPIPIHWNRGLSGGVSLRSFDETTVAQAYSKFLRRFDELSGIGNNR